MELIIEFAKSWGLNIWDWVAVLIAFSSFIIAMCSFNVARETLRSQKATQKNTTPLIKMDTQKMLWLFLIKQFYYKIQYLQVLKILLEKCKYTKKPEESFIQSLCILPERFLHEELFYSDKYKKYFGNVHWITKHILDYNLYVNSLANNLNHKNIKPENFDRLFSFIDALCKSLLKYYSIIFDIKSKNDFIKTLNKELFDKQKKDVDNNIIKIEKSGIRLSETEKYTYHDGFIEFFEDYDKNFENFYQTATNNYIEYLLFKERIKLVDD